MTLTTFHDTVKMGGGTGFFLRAAQLFHDIVTLTTFHDKVKRWWAELPY